MGAVKFQPLAVDGVRGDAPGDDVLQEFAKRTLLARVSPKNRSITVEWRPSADANGDLRLVVFAWLRLQQDFPGIRVALLRRDADVRLAAASGKNEDGHEDRAEALSQYLSHAMWMLAQQDRGLAGMMQHASWRPDADGGLSVAAIDALKLREARHLDRTLAEVLQSLSGVLVSVRIVPHEAATEVVREFQRVADSEAAAASREHAATREAALSPKDAAEPSPTHGAAFSDSLTPIASIQDEMRRVTIAGRVFGFEVRELPSGRVLHQFHLTDEQDSITCKYFAKTGKKDAPLDWLTDGRHAAVRGSVQFDTYVKDLVVQVSDLRAVTPILRTDDAPEKRVELHAHTQMSALDGTVSTVDLVSRAAEYGHDAIAITDHGVLQAFPDAHAAANKSGIKILYGVEAYIVDTSQGIVLRPRSLLLDDDTTYVVFDTETTGLSASEHELIEIAGVKMRGGKVTDTFAELIRPGRIISPKIIELTNITNEMVADKPPVDAVLPRFRDFCEGAVLIAHNAEFDVGFLSVHGDRLGVRPFDQPVIDTLALARALFPSDRNHRLKTLTQKFNVALTEHHRALADSHATGKVFYQMLAMAKAEKGVQTLADLAAVRDPVGEVARNRSFHATVLVKNQIGLKNLYRLVSKAHIEFFYREPRIPRFLLERSREGLLIGSGCKQGELFQGLLRGRSREDLLRMMQFYDYIELQPLSHYESLVASEEIPSLEAVKRYHALLLELADELGKPVVATGDVHFLDREHAVFREVILHTASGRDGKRAAAQPMLNFKTTGEMLDEFSHLGSRAKEVVVDNTRSVAAGIDRLSPVPDKVYPPVMEGAEEQVRLLAYEKARQLYGDPLPDPVETRLQKELHSIISHGFAVNYFIAHKLVTKSLQDGYIVGSRGSVGSSLAATFLDITEVNPLMPHYRCPSCKHAEFVLDGSIGSGYDLPSKNCPQCETPLKKDGQDIPFETFLGFKGDKVPDIDLNFSGEYQARAHKYTEELFGTEFVYRAGTISTIAEKTAFGYVRKWADETGKSLRNAEVARLVTGCTGIKRTTGQHPGGLIIVPNDREIYDFCPIQYPADDRSAEMRTTHFDFQSIHDNLLKLDILGHDDPTVLRMLQDLTGIDPQDVPVDDPRVYSLFSGVEVLGVTQSEIRSNTGTFGIPEFGTRFVRQMLEDTKPNTFADLVRISGLSHGTDVWLNNAQDLIRNRVAPLREVICCRDDIMVYLIYKGLEPSRAFKIMEAVRKGKGLSPEEEEHMASFGIPDWYLNSCQRIKYMFPKAHAAAYVLNAVRIAYFKLYHPLSFYAAYFTVRAEDLELETMVKGADFIASRLGEIEAKGQTATAKEKSLQTVLEVALEMTRRGFLFKPIDLGRSEATRFVMEDQGLLPPFAAVSGIGSAAAAGIVAAREAGPFLSVEDMQDRAHISRTVVEVLDGFGCLEGLPASNQLSLF